MITLKTDYVGEYKISKNCFLDLELYIEKYEPYYLKLLLGADLYALFKADLTAVDPQIPQTTRFLSIFNSFTSDEDGCVRDSEGIRKMLVQFIYFRFVRESSHFNTAAGQVVNNVEVSSNTPYAGYNLMEAYNQGIKNFQTIQWYIRDNDDVYPEENMQFLDYESGI